MRNLLLIRYGELGLKGKNKNQFIGRLVRNMRTALKDFDHATVRSSWGRLWAECNSDQQDEVIIALTKVFGIYSISPVIECDRNLEAMSEAVIQIIHQYLPNGGTFKVETRRADKTFPMPSPQISREVAMLAFKQLDDNYDADFFTPELMVDIEIRTEGVFVYGGKIHGAGGLPVGTGGKAML
ncbi:MAG: THUMP domain-containing protein, partial [Clostridia bacterium]|nr:THUMP domain-containing protein [Clostridia bacterium]